mgnify:CR=1 FL=1
MKTKLFVFLLLVVVFWLMSAMRHSDSDEEDTGDMILVVEVRTDELIEWLDGMVGKNKLLLDMYSRIGLFWSRELFQMSRLEFDEYNFN